MFSQQKECLGVYIEKDSLSRIYSLEFVQNWISKIKGIYLHCTVAFVCSCFKMNETMIEQMRPSTMHMETP